MALLYKKTCRTMDLLHSAFECEEENHLELKVWCACGNPWCAEGEERAVTIVNDHLVFINALPREPRMN